MDSLSYAGIADSNSNAHTDRVIYSRRNAHSNRNTATDPHTNPDRDTYSNANAHTHNDPNSNSNAGCDWRIRNWSGTTNNTNLGFAVSRVPPSTGD